MLVLQDRANNDFPLPERFARYFFPEIQGDWFINAETSACEIPVRREGKLEAERDRQGMLVGTVRFIPYHSDKEERHNVERQMNALAALLQTHRDLKDDAALQSLRDRAAQLAATAGYSILFHFTLMRTGECRIWFKERVGDEKEAKHDLLAEQAYYFIKDMVHDHTHHDATSDQITPLTFFDPLDEPGHENELKWRRETMWSLSREVERLNRGGNLVDQHRALGIIAYAEEFQSSLMSHVRDASLPEGFRENTTVHDFNFDHLKASIKASIDVKSARLSQSIQKTTAVGALFVSCLALVSSLVGTHNAALPRRPDGSVAGELISLGSLDWLLPRIAFEPVLTACIGSVFLYGLITSFIREGTSSLLFEPQRVLSQLGRAIAVTCTHSTTGQRWAATFFNLLFASLSLSICYCLFRLVIGGGAW